MNSNNNKYFEHMLNNINIERLTKIRWNDLDKIIIWWFIIIKWHTWIEYCLNKKD